MSDRGPQHFDFETTGRVYANICSAALIEESLRRGESLLAANGGLVVRTGKYTGRSPGDKFIRENAAQQINWGPVNQPFQPEKFNLLLERVIAYMGERDNFIFDGFAGADPDYRLPVRIVTEFAWHSLFARQLLLRPTEDELARHKAEFTIIDAARFQADPARDGTKTETFIILDFERRLAIIGGTEYAGEIKKAVFTVLNYLLPHRNVFPMHCAANQGESGDVTLFFGLSGTGKTTLSADPERRLIGDDEHGWSDNGVFNFEGGCYAKCIRLSREGEPQIWSAIRFGSVLENVVIDPATRALDLDSAEYTENTRAAYPIDFIPGAIIPSVGRHPNTILFLTADAFGVLPPISRLSKEQAMYYFLSGYTSKLAGTERGVQHPEATFSACFGGPFMPLAPTRYAELLGDRLEKHGAACYLINTGWTGGPYGVGKRMDLKLTRDLVSAAISGAIAAAGWVKEPVFGLQIPQRLPGGESLKMPRETWSNPDEYDASAAGLARRFQENFRQFAGACSSAVTESGPCAR